MSNPLDDLRESRSSPSNIPRLRPGRLVFIVNRLCDPHNPLINKTFSYLSTPGTSTSSSAASVVPDPRLFWPEVRIPNHWGRVDLTTLPCILFTDTHGKRHLSFSESCFALSRLLFTPVGVGKKKYYPPWWGSIHFTRGLTESAGLKHIPRTCFLGLTPPHHFFLNLNLDLSLVLFLHSTPSWSQYLIHP